MSRIAVPTLDAAPAASQEILAMVKSRLGFVPNLQRLMALSPSALTGWFNLMGPLSKVLDLKTRDGIALAVSEANGCDSSDEIALNRKGTASDPKRAAAIRFAQNVVKTQGKVSHADFAAVRGAGYTDAQIVEIVALAVQFLLTNFMNNMNDTDIDFPATTPAEA